MEMRVTEFEQELGQVRKGYEDNLQGYIYMATQNNETLIINEDKKCIICKAKDFWQKTNISVMDIEAENPKFKKCEYISDKLILEYDNRIIKIKTTR